MSESPSAGGPSGPGRRIPDLLHLDARLGLDSERVQELLELSFLGREAAKGIERELAGVSPEGDWNLDLFAEDLFVRQLIRDVFPLRIEGMAYPINEDFLYQVLSAPPTDPAAVRFRQEILRELDENETLLRHAERLYVAVSRLLAMFKTPDHAQKLDIHSFRLDVLRQSKDVIDRMDRHFRDATSGLRRLAEAGEAMRESRAYRRISHLLDYEQHQSRLDVTIQVGGDGEIKDLQIHEIRDNVENPHYTPHWKRWWNRLRSVFYGYHMSHKVLLNRLLGEVFRDVSPQLVPLVQVTGHLEVYLASLGFKRRMEARGLRTSLAEMEEDVPLHLENLFNPLLLGGSPKDGATVPGETVPGMTQPGEPVPHGPVPCDLEQHEEQRITLVTGPNSGGKTRLLQSVGLVQLLGQSGLFVPASRARLPMVHGLFVSLVETEEAHQAEGRLGREMMRIRRLFSTMGTPSLVILDELCSGTNPKEGIEIFRLVLRLLERLDTLAIISTHFLDFAKELEREQPVRGLEFLQVEVDEELRSTYQFVPGVADTSLAAETAQRLGVTFDELAEMIDERRRERGDVTRSAAETDEVDLPAAAEELVSSARS